MPRQLLVTGACGLIGTASARALTVGGWTVRALDLAHPEPLGRGDVLDRERLHHALEGCIGVLHLAAVSRVVSGERDPERCLAVNVEGTRNVLDAAMAAPTRPWVLLASSREVYGQADVLPVTEAAPLRPVNVYGRSKVAAEELTLGARHKGLRTAVVRLSNVFGSVRDHADRVVPAFARAAANAHPLRVDGADNLFDFTHVDDVARGLVSLVDAVDRRAVLPPLHFVSGVGTTLEELARLAVTTAGTHCATVEAPSRHYDVARFRGDPRRAAELVDWSPRVSLREGLERLVREFRAEIAR